MYKVYCFNIKYNKEFVKIFDSIYLCRMFVQKSKYSKKIKILSYPNEILK